MKELKLRIKGILLDLDGTMVDSREAYCEALKAAYKTVGQESHDERLAFEIPRKLEQSLPIDDVLRGIDVQKFLNAYLKAYHQATSTKCRPFPGIAHTLKQLSDKARLAVITMRRVSKNQVIAELERFGLAQYISHVVTALDTRSPKPSPDAILSCSKLLDVEAYDCVMVGDSVTDVRAGKNSGATTVAVLSGIFSRKELEAEKPDLILENVQELPCFLD